MDFTKDILTFKMSKKLTLLDLKETMFYTKIMIGRVHMNNKKKKIAIVSLIALCLVLLAFGTFAWWTVTRKQTNRNLVGSACLGITFSNETGDINLENIWPTTDSEGAALTPYTFRITNNCDSAVTYEIALESIEDDNTANPSYLN